MRAKLQILLVALICAGPIVAAYWLYYGGDRESLPRIANPDRALVDPAVPLPPLPLVAPGRERVDAAWSEPLWSLIYARTSPCGESCLADLVRIRQVQLALGGDATRVRRVYLGAGDAGRATTDRALWTARFEGSDGREWLHVLDGLDLPPGEQGRVYVVDPHGNLVLSYPPDAEQESLRDDLERLLDVSRIG